MLLEYSFLAIVVITCSLSIIYCAVTGISPVPSLRNSKRNMFDLLPADFAGEVIDLSTGWGSLAFPLARKFPQSKVFAYEISPVQWLAMQLRWLFQFCRNLIIERVNLLKKNFRFRVETKAVVCYLHSEALEKLRSKLERNLEPNTLVISNVFDIPGWQPESST